MSQLELSLHAIQGIPEIEPGADLGAEIRRALQASAFVLRDFDVVVVAHKLVSKAEGRMVRLADVVPGAQATEWASEYAKDPRVIEVALREARRVVRMEQGVLITETAHGLICANSGVDTSNVRPGHAVMLPEDPDRSAERLRGALAASGAQIAVVVCDTFGRPWREGLVNVAIGVAGLPPLTDYRGTTDSFGRTLHASVIATADEIASAAELVMGKTRRVPVVVVRGLKWTAASASAKELQRDPAHDLFR